MCSYFIRLIKRGEERDKCEAGLALYLSFAIQLYRNTNVTFYSHDIEIT